MATWTKISRWMSSAVGWVSTGAAAGFVVYCVHDSILSIILFQGHSMKPTIEDNDIGICDKTIPYSDIRRGDIVIASSPKQPNVQVCKRVLALAGDEIEHDHRKDGVYDDVMKFKYSRFIPRGHVWLEGDEKAISIDSRNYGPVPMGLIKSRVVGKIHPFRNAKIFAREPPKEIWDDKR